MILPILCPLDTVDDHVGFPQTLLQIGPVGDHEAYIRQVLLGLQHHVHVYVKDPHLVAQAAGQFGHAYANVAAAQAGNDGAFHTGHIGQQLAGAAVYGLHIVQRRQKTALTGQLAHGAQQGEVAVLIGNILVGHGGNMAVQQAVGLGRVGIGVDVGEQDLILVHPLELLGEQLLDLIEQIGLFPNGVGVRDDGTCRLIIAVRIATAQSRARLYVNSMAVAHDFSHRCGNGGNTVLIGLDLF